MDTISKEEKFTKWLTEETIQIAEERREAKGKSEIEIYKKLKNFKKKQGMIRR